MIGDRFHMDGIAVYRDLAQFLAFLGTPETVL